MAYGDARPTRLRPALLSFALTLGIAMGIVAAFTPGLVPPAFVVADLTGITVTTDRPLPPPPPHRRAPHPSGASAPAGRKATPLLVAIPPPRIVMASPIPAAPVVGTGLATAAGAAAMGQGTGAGGAGHGTGNGASGDGQGGGSDPVRIAGDISLASDFPEATRSLRIGDYVIVEVTVSATGLPTACRVIRPSRDTASNAITCQLLLARFRFRPATDGYGRPVEGVYGWMQRWHY